MVAALLVVARPPPDLAESGPLVEPPRRLYARAGFSEVGRRPGYYPRPAEQQASALVLRRDLV